MKRARLIKADYDEEFLMRVFKLVMFYGWHCVHDMLLFSASLNKAFYDWCTEFVFTSSILTLSAHGRQTSDCVHVYHHKLRAVPSIEVLKVNKAHWMHLYHLKIDKEHIKPDVLILAATLSIEKPFVPLSCIVFMVDGKPEKSVQKNDGHVSFVHHVDDTDQYHFVVCMKY